MNKDRQIEWEYALRCIESARVYTDLTAHHPEIKMLCNNCKLIDDCHIAFSLMHAREYLDKNVDFVLENVSAITDPEALKRYEAGGCKNIDTIVPSKSK